MGMNESTAQAEVSESFYDTDTTTMLQHESEYEVWKPDRLHPVLGPAELNEDVRKTIFLNQSVISILNKLTPENFPTLSGKMKTLPIDTSARMQQVVEIIHEKAIREWKFRSLYAKICDLMQNIAVVDESGVVKPFSLYLIAQCEKFFLTSLSLCEDYGFGLQKHDTNLCLDQGIEKSSTRDHEGKDECDFSRKAIGNCEFIGELFKVYLIHPKIIFLILDQLSKTSGNLAVECKCALLITIGLFYEEKIKKLPEVYFDNLESLLLRDELSPRIRFIIQDILDLKKNSWRPRKLPELPKTFQQIEQDLIEEEKNQKLSESMSRLDYFLKNSISDDGRIMDSPHLANWAKISSHFFNDDIFDTEDEIEVDLPVSSKKSLDESIREILSELTTDNFEYSMEKMKKLPINDFFELNCIAVSIIEEAMKKPDQCKLYAEMCHVLQSIRAPYTELESVFEHNKQEFHGKSVANCRFIGELFNVRVLSNVLVLRCVKKLVNNKSADNESLECLYELLKVAGKNLISRLIERYQGNKAKNLIVKLEKVLLEKEQNLSSEMKSLLEDLISMRVNSRSPTKGDLEQDVSAQRIDEFVPSENNQDKVQAEGGASFTELKENLGACDRKKHTVEFLNSLRDLPECNRLLNVNASAVKIYSDCHIWPSPPKRRINEQNKSEDVPPLPIRATSPLKNDFLSCSSKDTPIPTEQTPESKTLSPNEVEIQELCKSVDSILNELRSENVSFVFEKINKLPIDSVPKMQSVIDIIYDRAINDLDHFRSYVELCYMMQNLYVPDSGKFSTTFRMLLINKCQRVFESELAVELNVIEKQKEIDTCTDIEMKKKLESSLEQSKQEFRQKAVENCRLVGELFLLKMLTAKIVLRCVNKLLTSVDDVSLECLCTFLKVAGKELESRLASAQKKEFASYFDKIQDILKNEEYQVSFKVRLMLEDVINLKNSEWISVLKTNGTGIQNDDECKTVGKNFKNNYEVDVNKFNAIGSSSQRQISDTQGPTGGFKQWGLGVAAKRLGDKWSVQNSYNQPPMFSMDKPQLSSNNSFRCLSNKVPPLSSVEKPKPNSNRGAAKIVKPVRSGSAQNVHPVSRESTVLRKSEIPGKALLDNIQTSNEAPVDKDSILKKHLLGCLNTDNSDQIIKWIDESFENSRNSTALVSRLTKIICEIIDNEWQKEGKQADDSVAIEETMKKYMRLFKIYIENKSDLEMQCLLAVHEYVANASYPRGLLQRILELMYDLKLISYDSLMQWKNTDTTPRVAMAQLKQFFHFLGDTFHISLETEIPSKALLDNIESSNEELCKSITEILKELPSSTTLSLSKKIRNLQLNKVHKLQAVIDSIYNKALDEPQNCLKCAELCVFMAGVTVFDADSCSMKTFRALLVNKCQREMESVLVKYGGGTRRAVGIYRFVGGLFRIHMLTFEFILRSINRLLESANDVSLKCLCKLLQIIGQHLSLDQKKELTSCFEKIENLSKNIDQVSPGVKQDMINLMKNPWIPEIAQKNRSNIDNNFEKIHGRSQEISESGIITTSQEFKISTDKKLEKKIGITSEKIESEIFFQKNEDVKNFSKILPTELFRILRSVFRQWIRDENLPGWFESTKHKLNSEVLSKAVSELIEFVMKTEHQNANKCGQLLVHLIEHGYIQSENIIKGFGYFLSTVETQEMPAELELVLNPLIETGFLKLDDLNTIFQSKSDFKPVENKEKDTITLQNKSSSKEQELFSSSSQPKLQNVPGQQRLIPSSSHSDPFFSATSDTSDSSGKNSKFDTIPKRTRQLINDILKTVTPHNFKLSSFERKLESIPFQSIIELEFAAFCVIQRVEKFPELYEFFFNLCCPMMMLTAEKIRFWMVLMKACHTFFHQKIFPKNTCSDEIKNKLKGFCRFFSLFVNKLNNQTGNVSVQRILKKLLDIRKIDYFCEIYDFLSYTDNRFEKSLFESYIPELLSRNELEVEFQNMLKSAFKKHTMKVCSKTSRSKNKQKHQVAAADVTNKEVNSQSNVIESLNLSNNVEKTSLCDGKPVVDARLSNEIVSEDALVNLNDFPKKKKKKKEVLAMKKKKETLAMKAPSTVDLNLPVKNPIGPSDCGPSLPNDQSEPSTSHSNPPKNQNSDFVLNAFPVGDNKPSAISRKELIEIVSDVLNKLKPCPKICFKQAQRISSMLIDRETKIIETVHLICRKAMQDCENGKLYVMLCEHLQNWSIIDKNTGKVASFKFQMISVLHSKCYNMNLKIKEHLQNPEVDTGNSHELVGRVIGYCRFLFKLLKSPIFGSDLLSVPALELLLLDPINDDVIELWKEFSTIFWDDLNLKFAILENQLRSSEEISSLTLEFEKYDAMFKIFTFLQEMINFQKSDQKPDQILENQNITRGEEIDLFFKMEPDFIENTIKRFEEERKYPEEFLDSIIRSLCTTIDSLLKTKEPERDEKFAYALHLKIFGRNVLSFESRCINTAVEFIKTSNFQPGVLSEVFKCFFIYEIIPYQSLVQFKNTFVSNKISEIIKILNSPIFREYKLTKKSQA